MTSFTLEKLSPYKNAEFFIFQSIGKGSLWCIDPDYRPNLLQALRKTPYHPYHQLQMLANTTQPSYVHGYVLTTLPGQLIQKKLFRLWILLT